SPELRVAYRPRATFRALARQYRDYGRWRRAVAREHPGTMTLRYLAPPAAVVGLASCTLVGLSWWPALLVPAAYLVATTMGGLAIGGHLRLRERVLVPPVLWTMHLPWGWGFLTSRVRVGDRLGRASRGSAP
ncbi:MAG TPA: glycosyltransferase family 2 protein, partial [Dermatophilaceae bacterium]|nr:glycosyltransferase family 2 protein [Dermatophilaceae bacterium]